MQHCDGYPDIIFRVEEGSDLEGNNILFNIVDTDGVLDLTIPDVMPAIVGTDQRRGSSRITVIKSGNSTYEKYYPSDTANNYFTGACVLCNTLENQSDMSVARSNSVVAICNILQNLDRIKVC